MGHEMWKLVLTSAGSKHIGHENTIFLPHTDIDTGTDIQKLQIEKKKLYSIKKKNYIPVDTITGAKLEYQIMMKY